VCLTSVTTWCSELVPFSSQTLPRSLPGEVCGFALKCSLGLVLGMTTTLVLNPTFKLQFFLDTHFRGVVAKHG
jgi:hypothetical protein